MMKFSSWLMAARINKKKLIAATFNVRLMPYANELPILIIAHER